MHYPCARPQNQAEHWLDVQASLLKEYELNLGPDLFRWGGGRPREGVGAKKFGMPLETQ